MKKALFLFLIIVGLFACKEQRTDFSVKIEADYENIADSFLNARRNDSAFYYYNKIIAGSKDSLLIARSYNSMAIIQSDAGDYFGSQQSLLESLKFLNAGKEKDQDQYQYCLLSNYNELGSTSLSLQNYDAAINYYDLALKFTQDEDFKNIALNNKATAYLKKKQYAEAIAIYRSIIGTSKNNRKEYARVLSNLAKVKWLQDSTFNAAPDLLVALVIRKNEKDEWGLNASYSHLSDYYHNSHPDSALIYATKMYETTRSLDSPDDELEALQKLIILSPVRDLKQYFIRYQYLSDSIQTSRNAAKNQFALIRYDVEKNKTDNLRLQKENAERRIQIIKQWIILSITVFLLVGLVFRYRKRKQRLMLEAKNAIHKSQLKTSKKVHDVVANGLYRIMAGIEHNEDIDKEQLLDEIEMLYETSRDISHEQPTNNHVDFSEEIKGILSSFSTANIRVNISGNEKELWDRITENVKHELKHVLQELMVNMSKHSSAGNVAIRFEQQNNKLHIQYKDDGIGLQPGFKKGNGLTNTGNRINDIGGEFIFDSQMSKGFKIHIYIPIT